MIIGKRDLCHTGGEQKSAFGGLVWGLLFALRAHCLHGRGRRPVSDMRRALVCMLGYGESVSAPGMHRARAGHLF